MTNNNKYTNTEAEVKRLEQFKEQMEELETSFEYLYGSRWVRRFKRDNFRPENIEKLLLNVLLLKEMILGQDGLLELARNKNLDIKQSLYYAPTATILKEVEKRYQTGHVYVEEEDEDGYQSKKGELFLKGGVGMDEFSFKISDGEEQENGSCSSCENSVPLGRHLCDSCFAEEKKVIDYYRGNKGAIERIECKNCGKVYPVINKYRYLISPETKICWNCEEENNDD